MDTLNKVNPGDIRTGESFTEVYNDKGESVSGEKNEHSDGNLNNDNNLSSQSSDSDSDDIQEYFIGAVYFVENDSTHEDWIVTLKTCGTDVEYKLEHKWTYYLSIYIKNSELDRSHIEPESNWHPIPVIVYQ